MCCETDVVMRVFSLTGKFMQVFTLWTAADNIGLTVTCGCAAFPTTATHNHYYHTILYHIGHSKVGETLAEVAVTVELPCDSRAHINKI